MRHEAVLGLLVLCALANCETVESQSRMSTSLGRELVEEGRTMVHHAVKRFMIILPAIFFKLGIAFTLLVVVALAAVNNGFIGFLLLVVGLSSVLARLQGSSGHLPAAYISPLPPYHQHHAVWDRSDSSANDKVDNTKAYFTNGYSSQSVQYNPVLSSYYGKYAASKV